MVVLSMDSDCFITPRMYAVYDSDIGQTLSNMRDTRYLAVSGDKDALNKISNVSEVAHLSPTNLCKIYGILDNLPNNDVMRDSVYAKNHSPTFVSLHTMLQAGRSRMLLYGPPGVGKTTLAMHACAKAKTYPYIVTVADINNADYRGALGYMLNLETMRSPVLIIMDCNMLDDSSFVTLSTIIQRNPMVSIVGLASGLPRNVNAVKTIFGDRYPVGIPSGNAISDLIVQEDRLNLVFKDFAEYLPTVLAMSETLTIGSIVTAYRVAVTSVLDTIDDCEVVFEKDASHPKAHINCVVTKHIRLDIEKIKPVLTIAHLDSGYKENVVLSFVQGLLHASVHSLKGYEIYN